jgi:hypothetical protein
VTIGGPVILKYFADGGHRGHLFGPGVRVSVCEVRVPGNDVPAGAQDAGGQQAVYHPRDDHANLTEARQAPFLAEPVAAAPVAARLAEHLVLELQHC